MGDVIPMGGKLMKALKEMPGMAPFDENEAEYIKKIAKECRGKEVDYESVADQVRSEIHKYRHQKLIREIEMAGGVVAKENVVIENLRRRGINPDDIIY